MRGNEGEWRSTLRRKQAFKEMPFKHISCLLNEVALSSHYLQPLLKGIDSVAMSSVNDSLKKVSILTGLIVIKSKDAESII